MRWEDEPDPEALRSAQNSLSTNPVQALKKLRELANRGSTMSKIYLADAYEKGVGGAPDLAACEEWLRRASETGSSYATFRLGKLYLKIRQQARAYDAFCASASKSYAPAQTVLAEMYFQGVPIKRDVDRAIDLLEQAATQGHVYAKGRLAQLYLHGMSGYFFGGVLHPNRFIRGLWLWSTGFYDALVSDPADERFQI